MAQFTQPGRNGRTQDDQTRVDVRENIDPLSGPLSVLVVDEDADLRVYLCRCLQQFGPLFGQVLEASNGPEALSVVQANSIDLLICGSRISQMSSEALFGAIRSEESTASMLIVQVADPDPEFEDSNAPGSDLADAVLDSPFNAAGFGACLGKLI